MPEKWPRVALGEILTERNETPDPVLIKTGHIPIISKIRFLDGAIEYRSDTTTNTKMILIHPGDLVLSGINAMKGAIAIYDPETTQKAAATIHYAAYQVNKKLADIRYLWWLLRSQYFQEILSQQVPQGIKTELKAVRLLPVLIPLPELTEQQKIVEKLLIFTELVHEADHLHTITFKELEYLIQSSLAKELDKFKERRPFDEFFSESPRNGLSLKANAIKNDADQSTGGIPFIKLGAISFGKFNPNAIKIVDVDLPDSSPFWIQPNDLLMGRGNSMELVGRVVLYKGEKLKFAYPDLTIRLRVNPDKALPEFVELYMMSSEARQYIESKATGTSPTMKKVSQPVIAAIPFPDVPIEQQKIILGRMEILQKKVKEIHNFQEKCFSELTGLENSIISNMFRGVEHS
jgi:type I restriction enzyme, S subunit